MARAVIVVLNDGSTYTSIDGCCIVEVDEDFLESGEWSDLDDALNEGKARVLTVLQGVDNE